MPGNINTIPPSVIASWPEPNYVDPVQRTWLPAFAGTLMGISSLMVLTRLWLRMRQQAGAFGLDDWFLLGGWLAAIALTVFTILSPNYGADRHVWNVPSVLFEPLAEAAWAAELIFLIATGCIKISCLLFYRRLTAGTYSRRWKIAIIIAIWFTICYCIAFSLLLVFNCTPLDSYWKSYDPNYDVEFYCLDTSLANPLSGIISVISDFYSVLLPCLMLRHFDAPRRQKIALNLIFSLGLLVVAAGSARTYYLTKMNRSYDITWTGFDVLIWTQLEVQLALICAAAPSLRVLFRTYLSNTIKRSLQSSRHGGTVPDHTAPMTAAPPPEYSKEEPKPHASRETKKPPTVSQRSLTNEELDLESCRPAREPSDFTSLKSPATIDWPLPNPAKNNRVGPQVVKTPADFESYALHNLRQNRPPELGSSFSRMTFLRAPSEESLALASPLRRSIETAWEDRGR